MWFWGLKEHICKMTTSHFTTLLRPRKYAFLFSGCCTKWRIQGYSRLLNFKSYPRNSILNRDTYRWVGWMHKLCTRKAVFTLRVNFFLDFHWVIRPWRRTLTNGSDVKYVFSLANGSDVKTDEFIEWISYAVWAIKWLGTIPSVLDHQSYHSTLRQWWRQISHLRRAWFRRWTSVLSIGGSTRRCRNLQSLCHSRVRKEKAGEKIKKVSVNEQKSAQFQTSPAASPVILHHTVRRTWLFIAYSDERWLLLPILTISLIHFSLKGWENVLFAPGNDTRKISSNSALDHAKSRNTFQRKGTNEGRGMALCKSSVPHSFGQDCGSKLNIYSFCISLQDAATCSFTSHRTPPFMALTSTVTILSRLPCNAPDPVEASALAKSFVKVNLPEFHEPTCWETQCQRLPWNLFVPTL